MGNQKIVAAINEQMGNEFSAMLQYYAIAAHFGAEGLRELSAHFLLHRFNFANFWKSSRAGEKFENALRGDSGAVDEESAIV